MKNVLLLFFLLFYLGLQGQDLPYVQYETRVEGSILPHPFNGGIAAPQFSEVDLNNDGLLDLMVYDYDGHVINTYIQTNNQEYIYAPKYAQHFPFIRYFIFIKDYNGDGIGDIFAHSGTDLGLYVYQGYFENDSLKFTWQAQPNDPNGYLTYKNDMGNDQLLAMPGSLLSSFNDIDSDGDIDIVTIINGYFHYYKNKSVELNLGLNTLHYELESSCYGGSYEEGSTLELLLASAPGNCAPGIVSPPDDELNNPQHNGYSITTFDHNNDGDMDLLFGESSFSRMNLLTNTNNNSLVHFGMQDTIFPNYDTPVFSERSPTSFYLDVDFDGIKDLIVSSRNSPINFDSHTLFYKGQDPQNPNPFELIEEDWLTTQSIDFGKTCHPTFTDYNQDGLMDMVLGTQTMLIDPSNYEPGLILFENIGTHNEPVFNLVDYNWLNLNSIEALFKRPEFGDLDGDGDIDLLVGEDTGGLIYFENIAGPDQPYEFAAPVLNYMNIDIDVSIGTHSSPQMVDVDNDGLNDLLIGIRFGNIAFFRNEGTINNPQFNPDPESGINALDFGGTDLPTNSTLVLDIVEIDDEKMLFIGNGEGTISLYGNVSDGLAGTIPLIQHNWKNIDVGDYSAPSLVDIDRDGYLEIFVGNYRGGVNVFSTDFYVGNEITSTHNNSVISEIKLYPNPASDKIYFEIPENINAITIWNVLGQTLDAIHHEKAIETSQLPKGMYWIQFFTESNTYMESFIKE